jgi:hypothetical protein
MVIGLFPGRGGRLHHGEVSMRKEADGRDFLLLELLANELTLYG